MNNSARTCFRAAKRLIESHSIAASSRTITHPVPGKRVFFLHAAVRFVLSVCHRALPAGLKGRHTSASDLRFNAKEVEAIWRKTLQLPRRTYRQTRHTPVVKCTIFEALPKSVSYKSICFKSPVTLRAEQFQHELARIPSITACFSGLPAISIKVRGR